MVQGRGAGGGVRRPSRFTANPATHLLCSAPACALPPLHPARPAPPIPNIPPLTSPSLTSAFPPRPPRRKRWVGSMPEPAPRPAAGWPSFRHRTTCYEMSEMRDKIRRRANTQGMMKSHCSRLPPPTHLLQKHGAAAQLGLLPCSNASHTFHTSNNPHTFCRNMTRLPSWDFLSCALMSSRLVSMGSICE